jgi:phosphotransferase system  glucose/maltose/N-acetylglucosamine-specific IIC component
MVILLYALQGIVVGADFLYLKRIAEGLRTIEVTSARAFIPKARVTLIIHIVLVAITIVLIALIPVIGKMLSKIDTSVKLAENEDVKIELADEGTEG